MPQMLYCCSMNRHPCNEAPPEQVEPFTKHALAVLRASGRRLTRPLRRVTEALASSKAPLGAYDIRVRLAAAGKSVNVVTVYRILGELEAAGLIHRISGADNGYVVCTSQRDEPHPAMHLVCTECGCAEEVPIPRPALGELLTQAARHGFSTSLASVSITGLCGHCR